MTDGCPNPNCIADNSHLVMIDKKTDSFQWYECDVCHSNCYKEIENTKSNLRKGDNDE